MQWQFFLRQLIELTREAHSKIAQVEHFLHFPARFYKDLAAFKRHKAGEGFLVCFHPVPRPSAPLPWTVCTVTRHSVTVAVRHEAVVDAPFVRLHPWQAFCCVYQLSTDV